MQTGLLKALHPQLPPLSLGLPVPGICSHPCSVLLSGWCFSPLGGALSQLRGANKETNISWNEVEGDLYPPGPVSIQHQALMLVCGCGVPLGCLVEKHLG